MFLTKIATCIVQINPLQSLFYTPIAYYLDITFAIQVSTKNSNVKNISIENKTVLITGANRGIGKALVEEALNRGAKRVYAGARTPFTHPDNRVKVLTLDITNAEQIKTAAASIESLDLLINNAGLAIYDDLSDQATIQQHLDVNLFGMNGMAQAFFPLLIKSKGALVNVLSVAALASLPIIPAYSISKAAALSLTQSLRAIWAGQGVKVHAVLAGPVNTEMSKDLDVPKASPESVAQAIYNGVANGVEDIFPDPMSSTIADGWNNSVSKAIERQNALLLA